MKTVLLVPARSGSDRLPFKHLYPLTEAGHNALDILYARLRNLGLPMRLVVGANDRLYESIGRCIGWEVLRTSWVKEGDLLSTLKEGIGGFERAIVVYGDSPLVDAKVVGLLPEAPFAYVNGPPGLRPFSFTLKFIEDWIRELLKEQPMPFTGIRFPKPWATVKIAYPHDERERYCLDTIADVTYLRHLLRNGMSLPTADLIRPVREEMDKDGTESIGGYTDDGEGEFNRLAGICDPPGADPRG